MPTYEYRCPEGHEFERVQKMTGPPRAKCPICGRTATRRISGGAGLIFKGTGFYITDYGKDGKGPRVDKDAETKPDSAAAQSRDSSSKAEPTPKPEKAEPSEKPEKSEKKSSRKKASP